MLINFRLINVLKVYLPIMLFSLGLSVYADLEITEIMYNPEGADDGYEYVIIKNISGSSLDLSEYYFLEAETHHGLYPESDNLGNNNDAWVVKNIDMARSRYGDHLYVKSSFSLNNTGETLVFTDTDRNAVAEFSYNSDMGGNGDGTALSVSGSGVSVITTSGLDTSGPSSVVSENAGNSSVSKKISYEPYYTGYIETPQSIVATDSINIKAGVYLRKGEREIHKKGGYYYLNFGNGYGKEYYERIDVPYSYDAPGTYLLTLEYYHGKLAKEHLEPDVVAQKEIQVIEPSLAIIHYDGFKGLTLHNKALDRIDLEGWHLVSGADIYTFPKYSSIGAGQDLVVAREHLGFKVPIAHKLQLLNPGYLSIHEYSRITKASNLAGTGSVKETVDAVTIDALGDIEIGSNTLVDDTFLLSTQIPKKEIVFREDSLATIENENNNQSSKLPLWLFAGFIAVLVFLKSFFRRPEASKNNTKEPVYDIELIE